MTKKHTYTFRENSQSKHGVPYSADFKVTENEMEKINQFEKAIQLHSPSVDLQDKFLSGLGSYLRLTREALGMSIDALSTRSGIPRDIIDDLERNCFTRQQIESEWIYELARALSAGECKKRNQIASDINLFIGRLNEPDPYQCPYDLIIYWIESLKTDNMFQENMLIKWLEHQKESVGNISKTLILLASIAIKSKMHSDNLLAMSKPRCTKEIRALKHHELVFMSRYDIVRHWVQGFGYCTTMLNTLIIQCKDNNVSAGKMLLDWSELSLFPAVFDNQVNSNHVRLTEEELKQQMNTTREIENHFGR